MLPLELHLILSAPIQPPRTGHSSASETHTPAPQPFFCCSEPFPPGPTGVPTPHSEMALLKYAAVLAGVAGAAAQTCAPTDAELDTVVKITLAQQDKLEAQRAAIACLTSCIGGGSCTCGGGISGGMGPSPGGSGNLNSGIAILVDPEYAASLGTDAAFADCWLTPAEIASDPEAMAFAASFQAATAAQLGVDPSMVQISGISTDNDNTPGCGVGAPGTVSSGHTITVDPSYMDALGNDAAFADCYLDPTEIASDPEAALFAANYIAAVAAELGVDPSQIQVAGISTDGDNIPGCASPSVGSGVTVHVDPDYIDALGDQDAFADCFLTPEEIASDPEAAALAAQFIASTAAQLGVDPSAITLTGFSTDSDPAPGCQGGSLNHGLALTVDDTYAGTLGDADAFADCWLSPEEVATDPEAAAFVDAFVASTAAQLGVDPSSIVLNGVSTAGLAEPGCGTGR